MIEPLDYMSFMEFLRESSADFYQTNAVSVIHPTAMRSMQKALELMNKQMQDQSANLQSQAQKIKVLRSCIATVHCTMAGRVASFANDAQDRASRWQEQGIRRNIALPDPSLLQPSPYTPLSSQLANQDMRVSAQASLKPDAFLDRLVSPEDGLIRRGGVMAPTGQRQNGSFVPPKI